jgi:hypothetical protein
MRKRPKAAQKAGNVCSAGNIANFDGRRTNYGASGAQRECESSAVGKIAFRRKQQNQDRYEYDRRGAVWPGGRDPEKLDSTDSEKCACRIE